MKLRQWSWLFYIDKKKKETSYATLSYYYLQRESIKEEDSDPLTEKEKSNPIWVTFFNNDRSSPV
jgi:hypothetical protein